MDAKEKEEVIRKKYQRLHRAMDERARRLWAAAEAESLGHGGVSIVSRATGLTRNTISSGIDELASLDDPPPAPLDPRAQHQPALRIHYHARPQRLADALLRGVGHAEQLPE